MTALVSFIAANISVVFLVLIPFMSWALPFMLIPLAIMVPCGIVACFEFWQEGEISDAGNKLSRQKEKLSGVELTRWGDVYDFNQEQFF
ncbi:MAG: hypothetical protein LBD98_01895 [Endomicrobium sp.]|jgi:hypothetical protein|nr:hypothetical protein [Endomicrobium sp.]